MSKHVLWKTLSCDLSQEEISTYSQELARITGEQSEIEAEKKEVMSNFAAKLNKCVADGRVLARKIITKKEDRQVECDLDFDYSTGTVYTVRTDTGVTIGQRKLTDDERQERLDFEGEEDLKQEAADRELENVVQEMVETLPAPTTGNPETVELTPEQVEEAEAARFDAACQEWRSCDYYLICMAPENDEANICFKDEPAKLADVTKTGEVAA